MIIELKQATHDDLDELWNISFGPKANLEWMKYNGPYFNDPVQSKEEFISGFGTFLLESPMGKIITHNEQIIGIVTAHWIDGNIQKWLEVGIVIYDDSFWRLGIGSIALKKWLTEVFKLFPDLPHIGFTTWSGNKGMMKAGEKAGMTLEGTVRKVRYVNNRYYDSIKYGILREEL